MSLTVGTRATSGAALIQGWQHWWLSTTRTARLRFQVAVFGISCVVAYHYSLSTLVSNLSLSTPLAYLGLVPAIAIGVAAARTRRSQRDVAIHDRQLDWIVGVPLLAGAATIQLLLPGRFSAMFWVWRLDLLSFPLFVAGAVALIFGVRTLWQQRFAVGFLLLAWPLPYTLLLLRALNGFTDLTLSAMRRMVGIVHVAAPTAGGDGSVFTVLHHGHSFQLSVVSACSGVDSVVGFFLVGSAFAALVTGNRAVKAAWLLGGMLLLWGINLLRILFIFWAGQTWGEHVAINILHPFVGLVTFSLGVILMMLVMPLLGLHIGGGAPAPPTATTGSAKPAVTHILPAVGVLLAATLVLGTNNTTLKAYDLVANAAGEPKLSSFSANPATPQGWLVNYQNTYTWAKPYFGDDSTWLRYLYYSPGLAGGSLHASVPVTADVINTTALNDFSAYGVEACYNFHGYAMRDVATVKLTGGIVGQSLSYATGAHSDWSIVYWIMPVKAKSGGTTHYERVILYLQDSSTTSVSSPGVTGGIQDIQGGLNGSSAQDKRLIAERNFLVNFAKQVITNQAHIVPGSRFTPAVVAAAPTITAPAAGGGRTPGAPARQAVTAPPVIGSNATPAQVRQYNSFPPNFKILYARYHPSLFGH